MCLFAEHYRGAIGPEGFVQFRVNEIELAPLPLLLCHCQPRLNNKQVASNCFFLETWETFCVEAISECYYKLPLAMVSKYIFKIFDQTLMAKYILKCYNKLPVALGLSKYISKCNNKLPVALAMSKYILKCNNKLPVALALSKYIGKTSEHFCQIITLLLRN